MSEETDFNFASTTSRVRLIPRSIRLRILLRQQQKLMYVFCSYATAVVSLRDIEHERILSHVNSMK